ncbi:MAG: hypothetical protein L6263_13180 [Desulfobacteraceae bacterium]|nr:hypothetical protein [Desulfobacteraceae bacterium]
MNMIELEQMRREWVDVTRKNGFREGITDLLAHQYSEKTHFIFELLQNAEDALATEVEFRVESQRLVFSHNGERLFSDENVEYITSIGKSTKQTDYTQIGKHGIGFKAVFAYTHIPRIHSGDKHFDIEDVVIPCLLTVNEVPTDLTPEETRIILPFDSDAIPGIRRFRKLVPAETAKADISDALKKLNIRTLLFLRNIKKICWTSFDGIGGAYLRKPRPQPGPKSLRHVNVTDGDKTESWLVFEQEANVTDDGKDNKCIVEVAFLVENGKVIPARSTELVVYFPTEKKTGLPFLIQGPFKTTKARDNIKSNDDANQQMLETAAHLAADSLETLRDLKFLDVSSYLALPLQVPEDSFFHPVYDRIRETLKTKPLLPAYDGTFIKAQEVKLARGKELVNLFSPEQLSLLYGKENLTWLDASITESGAMADLHTYLVGRKKQWSQVWEIKPLWDGLLVDADTLAPKLTAAFLGRQPLPWLVKFIQYVMQPQSSSALKRISFIRLVSGEQVSLPANEEMLRPAYFAPNDDTGLDLKIFSLVLPELAANKDVRKFLEKEGIREIDAVAIVEKSVLPKYQDTNTFFNESTYRVDLRRIREAYGKANDKEKAQLNTSLNKTTWLACVHASGNAPNKIVWKKPGASDLFEKTADHETWFDGLEDVDAYFLHFSVVEILSGELNKLAKTTTALTTNLSPNDYTVSLLNQHSNNKQGLKGFNPNATIVGIKSAWASWNQDRSRVLWKSLLSAPLKIISGETQFSTNCQKLDKAPKKIEYTDVGELCRKHAWLLDKSGKWHMPSELMLTDLPDGFESTSIAAKEVAEKIGMRQPEREQALEVVTGGDHDFKMLIEHYQSASNDERKKILKTIPREVPPEPAPSFKDGLKSLGRSQQGTIEHGDKKRFPVSNPDGYQGKLIKLVADGVEEHQSTLHKITFSPVRDNPSNAEARSFLYEQYRGYCQVTETTFPKANRNWDGVAENYFEACSLLSYANADYLNNAGNMLCVSADTMAKFKYASVKFLESIEDAIETFKVNGESAESVSVKIRIAGEERFIQWNQRHFMRLIALYEKA